MELARAQLSVLDLDGAADTFEKAAAESADDRELELSAIAELSSAELNLHRFASAVDRVGKRREELTGATAAERKLLAVAASRPHRRTSPPPWSSSSPSALSGAAI